MSEESSNKDTEQVQNTKLEYSRDVTELVVIPPILGARLHLLVAAYAIHPPVSFTHSNNISTNYNKNMYLPFSHNN